MDEKRDRFWYISRISPGNIIAFKLGEYIFSGKVIDVNEKNIVVKTKNNSIYYVERRDIVWIKNGSHWPVGIYNALKSSN